MAADVHPDRDAEYRPKCPKCGAFTQLKTKNKTPTAGHTELVSCKNCGLGRRETEK